MKKIIFLLLFTILTVINIFPREIRANDYFSYLIQGDYAPQKIHFNTGDTVVLEKYYYVVVDVNRTSDGAFIYLLVPNGLQDFSYCCYLICHRQINMLSADGQQMMSETIRAKYVGDEEYKRGFQYLTCECFVDVNY